MYLPEQYTVSEVQEMDKITTLRRHFALYYQIAVDAKCSSDSSALDSKGVKRYYTGLANPFCNVVIGLPKSPWDEEISHHAAFFAEKKQSFVWYIDEKANQHFKERLKGMGFTYAGLFQGVIGTLTATYNVPQIDGIQLELVQDECTLDACIELISRTFHVPDTYKKAMSGRGDLFHWAAKKDGKVIATLTTLIDGQVVSFWNGATEEQYRRRGISTALRKLALNHAIAKGCRTGTSYLMAEALALGICKGLGYEPKWRFEVYLKE